MESPQGNEAAQAAADKPKAGIVKARRERCKQPLCRRVELGAVSHAPRRRKKCGKGRIVRCPQIV
jgi:hypothetical protein